MSVYGANTGISRLEPAAPLPAVNPLKNEQKPETMNKAFTACRPACRYNAIERTTKPIARAESVKDTNYPTADNVP